MEFIWMRDPATGATQEILASEAVRRSILLRAGWEEMPTPAERVAIERVTIRINDETVVLPPGAQPAPAPGHKLVDVTDHDSAIREFIEIPNEAPKRKRSK